MHRSVALAVLLLSALPALAQLRPTAYFSFEEGMEAAAGQGPIVTTVGGKPELVPGKIGRGLRVGPTFGCLECATAGVLNRTSGTVEMWVQAQDWQSDDPKFHVFFECRGQGALYLYKFWTTDKLLMLTAPAVEGPYTSSQSATTFAPGEWHHIDGTYHDQTHPYTSTNTRSGWGYVRDGKEHVRYPILGYRALYRRNYAMVKSLPWPTFTQAHMSGKVVVPVLAYDDSYLDGEQFRGVVKDSYMDVSTLEAFRAEYMGRQWGLVPYFLPEFDDEYRPQVEPTRGLMALLMIHDMGIWPIWCNPKPVDEAFAALDEFGYADAEFIPYFDHEPPASTGLTDVYTSAYRRADGATLLVVANVGKVDEEGDVRVDLERLGLAGAKAVSWPDKTELAMTDAVVHLAIPRLGYRMVLLTR